MGRAADSDYLGDVDLGLAEPVGCINRARLKAVGGATYADIKALMSQSRPSVDLDISPQELARCRNPRAGRPPSEPARPGGTWRWHWASSALPRLEGQPARPGHGQDA